MHTLKRRYALLLRLLLLVWLLMPILLLLRQLRQRLLLLGYTHCRWLFLFLYRRQV